MTIDPRKLSEEIVTALFTNGNDDVAERLVLELRDSDLDGGGWCYKAAVAQVEQVIRAKVKAVNQTAEGEGNHED